MSSHNLRLDGVAQSRASALLTPITTAVSAYNTAHGTSITANSAYVYTSAVSVGLNYWRPSALWCTGNPAGVPGDQPTVASFVEKAGTGTSTISVSVTAADEARCAAIIAALGSTPTTVDVLGCACCTGLAILSGSLTVTGPFV